MSTAEKYDRIAEGFSEREYADPAGYSERRATVIVESAPGLLPGQSVLDLCCADGIMAQPLVRRGLRYEGVDLSERMIDVARARNPGLPFVVSRCEEYEPDEPVDAVVCLRSFYQPPDRLAFFRRVAGYTRGKFVFDVLPRDFDTEPIVRDLREAGFSTVELRPFFMPQRRRLPRVALPVVVGLEQSGPVARLALRRFGTVFCVARV